MPISIRALRPSYPAFAGEVSEIDITRPIGREDVAAIEAGMDAYAVLVFRGQGLTDEQQLAFTLNFGGLERYKTPGHVRKREDNRLGPGIADFANLDKHGNVMSPEDRVSFFTLDAALTSRRPGSVATCGRLTMAGSNSNYPMPMKQTVGSESDTVMGARDRPPALR